MEGSINSRLAFHRFQGSHLNLDLNPSLIDLPMQHTPYPLAQVPSWVPPRFEHSALV